MNSFSSAAEAEAAFYRAFCQCSVADMEAVWGDGDVLCVHPGSEVLHGKPAVMQSWARILVQGMTADIEVEPVSQVEHDGLAVYTVYEHLSNQSGASRVTVVATNVYRKGDEGWRMIAHHGSQSLRQIPPPQQAPPDRVLQ